MDERFFRGYMTTAIGEMEGVAKKPAPDMVQKAMKILKTDTKKAIYVGDSEVDIQTAENTGLPCVSVCLLYTSIPAWVSEAAVVYGLPW